MKTVIIGSNAKPYMRAAATARVWNRQGYKAYSRYVRTSREAPDVLRWIEQRGDHLAERARLVHQVDVSPRLAVIYTTPEHLFRAVFHVL